LWIEKKGFGEVSDGLVEVTLLHVGPTPEPISWSPFFP
jgi:hypothetical protein